MRVGRVELGPTAPKRPGDGIVASTLRRQSLAERCRSLAADLRRAGLIGDAGDLEDVARRLEGVSDAG